MSRTLLLLGAALAGCASAPPASAPTVLTFPSELTRGSALGLARNVLRRAGWPAAPLSGDTLRTDAGPLRLVVTVADTDGGASTRVSL